MFERPQILSVYSHERVLKIDCCKLEIHQLMSRFESSLADLEISFPQIIHLQADAKIFTIFFTGPSEVLKAISTGFTNHSNFKVCKNDFASVTVTGVGINTANISQSVFYELGKAKILVLQALYSPMSLTVLIDRKTHDRALKTVHKLVKK